jgi:pyruvate dehydrogenase E2 component (dihydrolipoamide acetyltransferase)
MPEIDVPMPKLSMTMTEGELIAWRVQEGEQVRAGDVIAEVMSDKVEMEVESPADGTLLRHAAAEGDTVAVGAPLATVDSESEQLLGDLFAPAPSDAPEREAAPAPQAEPAAAPARAAPAGTRARAVPAARRRARELGVDVRGVAGSGPDGLVRVADVEAAATAPPAPPAPAPALAPAAAAQAPVPVAADADADALPVSSMRRTVARRLVESMQRAPHFYLTIKVDADALLALRAELNQALEPDGIKLSVNDLLVKACATALRLHPGINVSWAEDRILRHEHIHVGIAVALPDGLIVPVVRDPDTKSLRQISADARTLVDKARAGKLAPAEFSGGTFTISNLGMFGIDQFTAVINPPEAAILAVGATVPEVVFRDGEVTVRNRMALTLSIDHRPLDGATAAQFLQTLKQLVETPLRFAA